MNKFEFLQEDSMLLGELNERLKEGNGFSKANKNGVNTGTIKSFLEGTFIESVSGVNSSTVEAVILDFLRPCLLIRNNQFEIPASDTWKNRLEPYRQIIENRIPSVGRIEFKFHPKFKWGGTGWLIAENFIVTNRHVAAEFARRNGNGVDFARNSLGVTIEASIDFREEYATNVQPMDVSIIKIKYLADEGYPDIAILKLAPNNYSLEPIPILTTPINSKTEIVVIGYPAYDPIRNPLKPEDVTRIFGNIFEYKRLSPGLILNENVAPKVFSHDATTLGGNSGSTVLDLKTGLALGLHFSGEFHEANFAINAQSILDAITSSSVQVLTIKPQTTPPPIDEEEGIEAYSNELKAEDYKDRVGYLENFLGDDAIVPFPDLSNKNDVLKFGTNDSEFVLKYHHFSVVMSEHRRMCYLSAVNVNGGEYRKTKRPSWKLDPRIEKEQQIMKECYGNLPKFSRGHMTRREDPAWGGTLELATLGNADSMHVTNAVPQMQPFNAGIWLELEEYALQNAKGDAMKISVFTGPFLEENDPVKFDVKIPVKFWKVIAFIHDNTSKLCATGYVMSQEGFFKEFVFGQHKTYQISIRSIEKKAKISFGRLAELDPYLGEEVVPSALENVNQIVFQ